MSSPIRLAVATLAMAAVAGGLGVGDATARTHQAQTPLRTAAAPAGPQDTDPSPNCSDNNNTVPCWEYQTWYWTYANCNNAGPAQANGRYDHYVCVLTSNGVGVGLWLHKVRD